MHTLHKFLRPFFLIPSLLIFSYDSSAQSGLAGLADAMGSPDVPAVESKKLDNITPPLNIDNSSIDDYVALDKKCRAGDGSACLYAGKILMLENPPKEIFNLSTSIRIDRAIRQYEASISASMNLEAMELAYDLYYDKNIINRQLNSYTDKGRARELMDQMLVKKYPGGQIRQARDYIEDPEYILSIGKKKEACATARNIAARQGISSSTKTIADDLLNGNICIVLQQVK